MKTLRLIGMALVAIIMSMNFVACSDDDDDNPIVGVWQNDDEDEHLRLTFNADGSGEEYLFWDNDSESYRHQFTYTYDSATSTLVITYEDGDTTKETVTFNGNTMTLAHNDDKEGVIAITYKKM